MSVERGRNREVAVSNRPVPDNKSLLNVVVERWKRIDAECYQGLPVDHLIDDLDNTINQRIKLLESGELDPRFSWAEDIENAKWRHRSSKSWMQRTIENRNEYVGWWRDFLSSSQRDTLQQVAEARKFLLASHGAAILGSMAGLASTNQSGIKAAFTAIAIGGLIGFMLAAIGIIVWFESYGSTISKMHSDFRSTHKIRRYNAYSKYLGKRFRDEARWSIWLSYASVVILPIYAVIGILFLFFSK